MGDIGQLVGRDVELLGQDLPVTACLVQHVNEVAVFKDVFDLPGGQQVLDVLGNARRDAAPLPESLPDLHGVGGGLLFLEQQMEFIDVVAGASAFRPVGGHATPDLVLDDEHAQLFQLLAQFLDVKANQAVLDIHIGPVVEDIERAADVDFQGCCNEPGFLFRLLQQDSVQVSQDGDIFRLRLIEIGLIHHAHAAVDDGLFDGLEALSAADDELAQGENEVGFQGQRALILGVVQIDVHGINVVTTGGRDLDDLALQTLHQRVILALRIADGDVVLGDEKGIGNFSLGREGLATARGAQDQAVRVFVKKNFFITGNISRFDML